MLQVKNLSKVFIQGDHHNIKAVDDLSFNLDPSEWLSVTGRSGSGKSTLLTLLAGLDLPSSGEVVVNGQNLAQLSEDQRAAFRAQNFGFIFQSFRLMPTLTAVENVMLPLELLEVDEAEEKSLELLKSVGLEQRARHLPSELSGGEQQRVAVARAFAPQPKILFADEPTGNLDSQSGQKVLALLQKLREEKNTTLVVVTHDKEVASLGSRQLAMRDGKIFN